MPLLLYAATAALLLWLVHRYVRAVSIVAALVLAAVPIGLTGPALLEGAVYGPLDHLYHDPPLASMASAARVGPRHNAAAVDVVSEFFPWRLVLRESLSRGEWPLWNAYNLAGVPLAGSAQAAPYSPFTLLACLLPVAPGMSYSAALAMLVAAISAFLFARELTLGEGASLLAAIGWGLAGSIVLYCHTAMGFATAYLPLLLAATRRVVDSAGVAAGGLLTIALALTVLAGHPESLFLNVVVSCAYGLFALMRRRAWGRPLGVATLAGAAALLITAIFLLPLLEAIPQSIEYHQKSVRKVPDQSGAGVLAGIATNFFPHLHVRPWLSPQLSYIDVETGVVGSLILMLAIYAVWRRRSAETYFFAGLAVFGIVVGAGWPPLVEAVRALPLMQVTLVARFAFSAALALVILAAYGLDRFLHEPEFARLAFVGGSLLVILSAGVFWLSRHVVLGDPGYGKGRIVAELLFLAVAVVLLLVRAPVRVLLPALLLLLFAQRFVSERTTFHTYPEAAAYPPLALLDPLRDAHGLYRVTAKKDAFPPSTNIFYGLEDVRGYEALTFAPVWHTFPLWSGPHGVWYNHVESLEAPFLSFLNVRFAIQADGSPIPNGWRRIAAANGAELLENAGVIERIFVPESVAIHSMTAEETVGRMLDAREFRSVAWISSTASPGVHENGPGTVTLVRHSRGGEYVFDANMRNDGWVVISDVAWHGWHAYIDGRPAVLHGANAAFMAVFVPRGTHRVHLRYLPTSFVAGAAISFTTLGAFVAWAFRRRAVQRRAAM